MLVHNCDIGRGSRYRCADGISGSVTIEDGLTIIGGPK